MKPLNTSTQFTNRPQRIVILHTILLKAGAGNWERVGDLQNVFGGVRL